MEDLTEDEAKAIYRLNYWFYGGIADDGVASKVFDMGVNMGPSQAVLYLQRCLCDAGRTVAMDGRLGPLTLTQTNASDPTQLLRQLCEQMVDHYQKWVAANPNRQKFLDGLLDRANDLPSEVS